jgi:hypothetical protein
MKEGVFPSVDLCYPLKIYCSYTIQNRIDSPIINKIFYKLKRLKLSFFWGV